VSLIDGGRRWRHGPGRAEREPAMLLIWIDGSGVGGVMAGLCGFFMAMWAREHGLHGGFSSFLRSPFNFCISFLISSLSFSLGRGLRETVGDGDKIDAMS
jgi:hypothetical protein